jgi:hemerythrin-like domain-containing protein
MDQPTDMKITEALLAEHVVFHNLFDHLEATLPRLKTLAEVRVVAHLLESMLAGHSRVEDRLILDPLEHCIEQLGQQESFRKEHEEIDENLRLIRRSRDLKSARRQLLAAVVFSRKHFDKEERLVFPLAEKLLKTQTQNELGDAWIRQRKAV